MNLKNFSVESLGIAAFKIKCNAEVIYLDAFAVGVDVSDYGDATHLLITHADEDHFDKEKVTTVVSKTSAIVIGPKIVTDQLDFENMVTLEPAVTKEVKYSAKTFSLTAYRTKHFVGHEAPNNSYHLEIDGKSIFISGDSYKIIGIENIVANTDLYIYNFVIPKDENLQEKINNYLKPKSALVKTGKIILSHMIDLDWVYTAQDISPLLDKMKNIIIHKKKGEIFTF